MDEEPQFVQIANITQGNERDMGELGFKGLTQVPPHVYPFPPHQPKLQGNMWAATQPSKLLYCSNRLGNLADYNKLICSILSHCVVVDKSN